MCTYEGARYLPEQLQSLAEQSRLPDELVVCDDGSTDETIPILEDFAKRVAFPVRIQRNTTNLGYSRNFAQSIGLCTGDVIALSDQDDRWFQQKLVRLDEIFRADETAGGVFSNGDLMNSLSESLPGDLWNRFGFDSAARQKLIAGRSIDVLLKRYVVTGMTFAFRTVWRDRLKSIPASWPHDAWLALMLAREGQLRLCEEHLVAYRVHESQQIGVPNGRAEKKAYVQRYGIKAYLELSRSLSLREYNKDATRYGDLLLALEAEDGLGADLHAKAAAKLRYARRGAALLTLGRLRRLPHILGGWRDYQRYAPSGMSAMLRDLLF